MKLRDPGSAPNLGDRVPYIGITTGDKKTPLYDRAEDPAFALENNLAIDTNYYIENQVIQPIIRLLEPIYKSEAKIRTMLLKETYPTNIKKMSFAETEKVEGAGSSSAKSESVKTEGAKPAKKPKKMSAMASMLSAGKKTLKKTDLVTKRPIPEKDLFADGKNDALDQLHLSDKTIKSLITDGYKSDLFKSRCAASVEFWYSAKEFERTKIQCMNCLGSIKTDNMTCANNECNMFYNRMTSSDDHRACRNKLFKLGAISGVDLPEEDYVC